MEFYPKEISQDPNILVGLNGVKELCELIQQKLKSNLKFVEFTGMKPRKKKEQINERKETKGIINSKWLYSQLNIYPSVVISCHTFDPYQGINENEIIEQMKFLSQNSERRLFKSIILLFHCTTEKVLTESFEEKISSLKKKQQFEYKKMEILYYRTTEENQDLQKIQELIRDFANKIFEKEIQKIKKILDHLNQKETPINLAKYYFKMGFFLERKNNRKKAITIYKKCYGKIQSFIDEKLTTPSELKAVSEVVNICILRILFRQKNTKEAFKQFQKHMIFTKKLNPQPEEYSFIQYEYISQQYLVLAHFVKPFSKSHSSSHLLHWQNFGFFINIAVDFAIKRQKIVQNLISKFGQNIQSTQLISQMKTHHKRLFDIPNIEFIGKIEEKVSFYQELKNEQNFNHSNHILNLLNQAKLYYSKKREGFRNIKLVIEEKIADQLFQNRSIENSLETLSEISNSLRQNQWWSLLSPCLLKINQCQSILKNSSAFVYSILELLLPKMDIKQEQREKFQEILEQFLENPESFSLKRFPKTEIIRINEKSPLFNLVKIKIQFSKIKCKQNENFSFQTFMTSYFPKKIKFRKIEFHFNSTKYNRIIESTQEKVLELEPEKPFKMEFNYKAIKIEKIKCTEMTFFLGTSNNEIAFKLNPFEIAENQEFDPYRSSSRPFIDIIMPKTDTTMEISSEECPIVNEFFPIKIIIKTISENIESAELVLDANSKQKKCNIWDESLSKRINGDRIALSKIPPNSTLEKIVHLQARNEGHQVIHSRLDYKLLAGNPTSIFSEKNLQVQEPFSTSFQFLSPNFKFSSNSIPSLSFPTRFFLLVCFETLVDFPLEIVKCELALNSPFKEISNQSVDIKQKKNSQNGIKNVKFSKLFCIIPPIKILKTSTFQLGKITLGFYRKNTISLENQKIFNSKQKFLVSSSSRIPSIQIHKKSLVVDVNVPKKTVIGKVFKMVLLIENYSHTQRNIKIEVDSDHDNESYYFSGLSLTNLTILPRAQMKHVFLFVMFKEGLISLPQIQLKEELPNKDSRLLPISKEINEIYVYPNLIKK
ncbi:trafficking protein particle complex subunit 11 [Anaeramoeba ignava]|uniref:Trafficking protein particle complex subunit 11 n=1 Tax=Anaeramoeba ignava TaxID=1746090 RepID=A0A9Q0LP89_ANAIG|nr:trafficking protein particle complex subunit 11 [Anaeramoeba ignava]